jgi:hypothetical protein
MKKEKEAFLRKGRTPGDLDRVVLRNCPLNRNSHKGCQSFVAGICTYVGQVELFKSKTVSINPDCLHGPETIPEPPETYAPWL